MPDVEFFEDPAAFLAVARDHLAADPVVSTVVATIAERAAREDAAGVEHELPHRWWAAVRDDAGAVAGVAMRTAPFAPYPLFVLPMPDAGAVSLARALCARGEQVGGVNGALPAARVCADELARGQGRGVETSVHTRLHEARAVTPPPDAAGRLRLAREHEAELALAWLDAFAGDADEQAGREPGTMHHMAETPEGLRRRIAEERLFFWVDDDDRPVHLTGVNPPAFGVARVGPVYTPVAQRGRGYAGNAVAAVTRRILDGGARACLYTDQANPGSNRLYAALGYRPVVDMVEMSVR